MRLDKMIKKSITRLGLFFEDSVGLPIELLSQAREIFGLFNDLLLMAK